jgi:hypothetical protein
MSSEQFLQKYNVAPNPIKGVMARYAQQAKNYVSNHSLGQAGTTDDGMAYANSVLEAKSRLANMQARMASTMTRSQRKLTQINQAIGEDTSALTRDIADRRHEASEKTPWYDTAGEVLTGVSAANDLMMALEKSGDGFTKIQDDPDYRKVYEEKIMNFAEQAGGVENLTDADHRAAHEFGMEAIGKKQSKISKAAGEISKKMSLIPSLKRARITAEQNATIEKMTASKMVTREKAQEYFKTYNDSLKRMIDRYGEDGANILDALDNIESLQVMNAAMRALMVSDMPIYGFGWDEDEDSE